MNFIFENDRPIYLQLVEQLKLFIISGKFKPGEKIPSVRDLANISKVNPNTMQKALTELETLNLIYTERTNGKYVTNDKIIIEKCKNEIAKFKTSSYLKDMEKLGFSKEQVVLYLKGKD